MPENGSGRSSRLILPVTAMLAVALTACSGSGESAGADLRAHFTAAASEFHVPENVLLAVSYNMTNWQFNGSAPNAMGGYGPMGLLGGGPAGDTADKSGKSRPAEEVEANSQLALAARALGVPTESVRTDSAQNVRAAAALLASDAKDASGKLPGTTGEWAASLAKYSGSPSAAGGQAFAEDVLGTLHKGATARASDGETLTVPADPTVPVRAHTAGTFRAASPTAQAPDCPSTLDCRFVPAAYDWSSADHSDPNNYGNYDPADRPADGDDIRYIIIHDTESSYDAAIGAFQSAAHQAASHYVIRSSDGQVTQMVPNGDVGWDVANWTMNQHSISIEHEGYATQGANWYTSAQYRSSAALVRYLAAKYHVPIDRQHIIAHEDVAGELTAKQAGQHWDPGPYWDWQTYMKLLGAPIAPTGSPASGIVTISPDFAGNQPPVTSCQADGSCAPLPAQGANFVYLRTAPNENASLITDRLVYPDRSAGSTDASEWTDKAVAGHQYAVAGHDGDWTAIWYGGQKAWFFNPGGRNAVPADGRLARPRAGAVALYGRAFPDMSAYPSNITVDPAWAPTPLDTWSFPAGQSYVVVGRFQASNYYARFDPVNVPGNHTLVSGKTEYLLLDYNHRYVWVKADDVSVN
ncbi:N-acetylmuramoyl-L-alanine amidase [Amycolatopsis pigmentata]|uniref:N-acetylmuramoyl-L-alanine amidase n=1 Tax=Amycolatopsis pigmentata TaxID=450801 RepID=A0ABW5G0D8_9PSEU